MSSIWLMLRIGALIYFSPLRDNPKLGSDPEQNNDFSYTTLNPDDQSTEERCPFAAHTRKTNPRGDLNELGGTHVRRILRRDIQHGPELTHTEKRENRTIENRGLLFACYQSNIFNGFRFIQESKSCTQPRLLKLTDSSQNGPTLRASQ